MTDLKNFNHIDLLFPSNYLKAGDLRGREWVVIIESIEPRHELKGEGGKKDRKPIFRLKAGNGQKIEKAMICNKTNAKRIAALYGPEVTEWIGKAIVIRAEPEPKSDSGEAIRVKQGEKPKLPAQKPKQNGASSEPPAEPTHDEQTGEVTDPDLPADDEPAATAQ